MKSLKYYIVMTGVLTAILSGCENKNVETSQPVEAAGETPVKEDIDQEKGKFSDIYGFDEMVRMIGVAFYYGLRDFDNVMDLPRGEAAEYCYYLEENIVGDHVLLKESGFDVDDPNFFKEHGIEASGKRSVALINRVLYKYLNVDDVRDLKKIRQFKEGEDREVFREHIESKIEDGFIYGTFGGYGGGGVDIVVRDVVRDGRELKLSVDYVNEDEVEPWMKKEVVFVDRVGGSYYMKSKKTVWIGDDEWKERYKDYILYK